MLTPSADAAAPMRRRPSFTAAPECRGPRSAACGPAGPDSRGRSSLDPKQGRAADHAVHGRARLEPFGTRRLARPAAGAGAHPSALDDGALDDAGQRAIGRRARASLDLPGVHAELDAAEPRAGDLRDAAAVEIHEVAPRLAGQHRAAGEDDDE